MESDSENEIVDNGTDKIDIDENPNNEKDENSSSEENERLNEPYDVRVSSPSEWEELHGNYVLRPPDPTQPPRALIHFLGGAFVGAAPDIAYRYLLERLSIQGYLIVATPYNLSFDYITTCDTILDKFERIAPMLARQYGAVPVVGVGHSCGALLHLLVTTLFPDTPRAANALISFNNKEVKEAVPLFEELVSPFFQLVANNDTKTNGITVLQQLNQIAKTTLDGEIPSDALLQHFTESILPPPLQTKKTSSYNNDPNSNDSTTTSTNNNPFTSFIKIPPPLRTQLQNGLTSTLAQISPVLPTFRQSIDVLDQIPLLIQEVADGASEFNPSPTSIQAATKRAYRARRTLLLQYKNDPLDESTQVETLLQEAETVMRMKRPMIQMDVQRIQIDGNHATPILAPPGVSVADRVEDVFGGAGKEKKDDDAVDNDKSISVLYKQVDETVEVLANWLEEGQL